MHADISKNFGRDYFEFESFQLIQQLFFLQGSFTLEC